MEIQVPGRRTKNGVFVFDDFRDNLIIDRYDPVFATMRGTKLGHLRSENSEDALTWNVFRTLRQIDPAYWFPPLFAHAFGRDVEKLPHMVDLHLWPAVAPPPELFLFQGDEGESEIDILIETERATWFIEAKYRHDVKEKTTNNPERDQVLRNIDVGSWYAGVRDFYFALLVLDDERSPVGIALIEKYAKSKDEIMKRLPHRPDGLLNLKGIGLLTWEDLAAVLSGCTQAATREVERYLAERALDWLQARGVTHANSRPSPYDGHGHSNLHPIRTPAICGASDRG